VRSEAEAEDEARRARASLTGVPEIGDLTAELLYQNGFKSAEEVAQADVSSVAEIDGVGAERAPAIVQSARERVVQLQQEAAERAVAEAAAAEAAAAEAAAAEAAAAEVAAPEAAPAEAAAAEAAPAEGTEEQGEAGGNVEATGEAASAEGGPPLDQVGQEAAEAGAEDAAAPEHRPRPVDSVE
jgi:NAD-dependent DNA ligase